MNLRKMIDVNNLYIYIYSSNINVRNFSFSLQKDVHLLYENGKEIISLNRNGENKYTILMNRTFILIFLNIFLHFRDINECCITIQENMCSSNNIESILYNILSAALFACVKYTIQIRNVLKNKILMDRDWNDILHT